jgi:molybdopterin synthase catalytic subunit
MFIQNNNFLVDGPISSYLIGNVIKTSDNEDIGAHSIFLGQVRQDTINGQLVIGIEYSAYQKMLDPVVQSIIDLVATKYSDIKKIHISHSTGLVKTGEISLLVFVACGHRKESFCAVEEIVELIKVRLPVWKKEIFQDNTYQWPNNKNQK